MDFQALETEIKKTNYKFWHTEQFDNEDCTQELIKEIPNYNEFLRKKSLIEKDAQKVTPELRQFYCEPLLSYEQEQHIFRRYNFYKYKYSKNYNLYLENQDEIYKSLAVKDFINSIEDRNFIVRCNTRLAAKVIQKRKDFYGDNIGDLISDCFYNIIKAVDGFDFRRGFKFSTYCIWVLMNNTLREHQNDKKFYDNCCTNAEGGLFAEKIDENDFKANLSYENAEGINSDINKILNIIKQKDEREYFVLVNCFGLNGKQKRTLKEISVDLKLTKERVRQIKENSLKHLKYMVSQGKLDLSIIN